MMGNHGMAKYMDSLKPSVYRHHSGGIWAGIDHEKQVISHVTLFYWLAVYYKRIGKHDAANKFSRAANGKSIS